MANEVRLEDAPCGLFRHGDVLGFKTEYYLYGRVEAYVVESGELFYGGTETAQELNNLLVMPVDPSTLRPTARWAPVSKREDGAVEYECTNCGQKAWEKPVEGRKMGIDYGKYCIECGAKMEG